MAIVSRKQLKAWFRRGLKPLESQFASWIDSFWHKDDAIPMSSVDGLTDALNQRTISIDAALSDTSENPVQNKVIKNALDNIHIEVDDALSDTSENPVQNKVIKEALDNIHVDIEVDDHIDEASENPVQNKVIAAALAEKVNKDGTYQGLTAGGLVGSDTDATRDERQSFLFRSTAGSQSITSGDSKVTEIFGNVVNGQPFNCTHFGSSSDNHFNKQNVMNKSIASDGTISSSVLHKIAYLEVMQGAVGETANNGYVIKNKTGFVTPVRVGFTTSDPTTAASCTVLSAQSIYGERVAYIPPTHGWLLIDLDDESLIDVLFVTLGWSKNTDWAEFDEKIIELPVIHSWGYGKAGSAMDYVSTLEQIIKTAVDRILMTDMTWAETSTPGDNAYSDTALSSVAGAISTASALAIEVGGTSYERYSDGDSGSAYAWKDTEDNILYTASATPAGTSYLYTSHDLEGLVKASTSNLDHYGLSSSLTLTVDENGAVKVASATQITPSSEFSGVMLYYELATTVITPYEGLLKSYAHDFGYERFFGGNGVPPTYATIFYLHNLTDEIRALVRRDTKRRSYTVTFKDGATMAFDVNMEGALNIVRIKAFNVATLRITTGSYVQHTLTLTDGVWTGEIPVADLALVTWEATYVNSSTPASIGVNYEN